MDKPVMYCYAHDNFVYTGILPDSSIIPCPASARKGIKKWLIPARCTEKRPPDASEGQVAVFNTATQEWQLVDDYRGKTLYKLNPETGIIDNRMVFHTDPPNSIRAGEDLDMENVKTPEYRLNELKQKTQSKINAMLHEADREFMVAWDNGWDTKVWSEYRVALRAVPEQALYPTSLTLPIKPEHIKKPISSE